MEKRLSVMLEMIAVGLTDNPELMKALDEVVELCEAQAERIEVLEWGYRFLDRPLPGLYSEYLDRYQKRQFERDSDHQKEKAAGENLDRSIASWREAYREHTDSPSRKAAMAELTRLAQEMGLYE